VTLQVVGIALDAAAGDITEEAAPAPFAALDDLGTIDIDTSVTTDDGATVTVKGTISGTATDEDAAITIDLDSTWSGLKVVLDDGTTVTTTGSQSIDGTITVQGEKVSIAFTTKGSMTIDGKGYAFDIVITADSESNTLTYTGTINGFPVSKTVNLPSGGDDEEEVTIHASCLRADGDSCQDMIGLNYEAMGDTVCSNLGGDTTWTPLTTSCADYDGGWVGKCDVGMDSPTAYTEYYTTDMSTECAAKISGGTWTPL
jgi:hypothetical protein